MPSQTPASFASAAASSNVPENGTAGRNSNGSGDWSRRPNGATQTFRRPSQLNTNSATRDNTARDIQTPTSGAYVPPHLNSAYQSSFRNGQNGELRYSKDDMLDAFKDQENDSNFSGILGDSMHESWEPRSGTNATSWRLKTEEHNSTADVCWDFNNSAQPLGLVSMTDEERDLFQSSVNSPLKAPPVNKDGTSGTNGRKSSISQGQGTPSGLRLDRPAPRRRETSDSIGGGPGTPNFLRRDEPTPMTPPSSLLRRRTDYKEGSADSSLGKSSRLEGGIDTSSPFQSWKRTVSGPMSAGITGPSSPWAPSGPQSAGFGAFGNLSYDPGTPTTPNDKRPGFGSMRTESRFKSLMTKESLEEIPSRPKDSSMLGMGKRAESFLEKQGGSVLEPHQEEKMGSAALYDNDPLPSFQPNPAERRVDDLGFGSLGMPMQPGSRGHQDIPSNQATGTGSPSGTNPYQSPESDIRHLIEDDGASMGSFTSRMQASKQQGSIGAFDVHDDRSHTSSTGPQRNFPPATGLGNLSGLASNSPWSTANATGTFGRQLPAASGSGIFSSMADISSPGGAFGTPTSSAFPAQRSRLGGLFADHNRDGSNDNADAAGGRIQPATGFPFSPGDLMTGAAQRSAYDDLFTGPNLNENNPRDQTSSNAAQVAGPSGPSPQFRNSPESSVPPVQQKQMVMPDRMRWVYRDPSGQLQGPWTGLEMHDWYKSGYFSPELQVKKLEDYDYEPLAQLIRRIGNSREPFLVPQIGIPHGKEAPLGKGAPLGTPGGNANLGISPPFGNQFPSFGTTLTAEEQNNLERRKQEEQVLMARQKEHLQQQQQLLKSMIQGVPTHQMHYPRQPSLSHQASGQSLNTQPSFGNISSTGGFMNPSAAQGHGLPFSSQGYPQPPLDQFTRGNDLPNAMDRLNLSSSSSRENAFNITPQQQDYHRQQQVSDMLQDRARLQAQQEEWNATQEDDGQAQRERYDQFNQLRAGEQGSTMSGTIESAQAPGEPQDVAPSTFSQDETQHDGLSVDEPIVHEASQAQMSPLPAPAARRNRQHVADQLAAESSRSETSIDSPGAASLAPWAKESQASKAPSFQEIQEAEARKAAQQEEIAAAARRQHAEQERINSERAAAIAAQAQIAGLPSSANWATGSPAATSSSPWAKPATGTIGASATTSKTKTLAQIQKEEESRKQRAAAAAAVQAIAVPIATPGGKSYANLASKVAAPAVSNSSAGGVWNVVGASGKAKTPASPVVTSATRSTSSGIIPTTSKPKPQPVRSNTGINGAQVAQESFQRWVKNSLGNGLNSSISVDDFVKNLVAYPLEEEIISDAIYGNSQTLDGNRFAREFIQRKKEADKGKVLDITASNFIMSGGESQATSGGWNEVAKKAPAPAKEEPASTFKVVPAKKKGKR